MSTKQYRDSHKDSINAYAHNYYLNHVLDKRLYYQSNKNKIRQCQQVYQSTHGLEQQEYHHLHNMIYSNNAHKYVMKLKTEVLTHYGNGKLACAKCGISDIDVLSIDHINGNGRSHVKSIRKTLYRWLKDNNFPDGFQTLCMNCNWKKRVTNNEMHHKYSD